MPRRVAIKGFEITELTVGMLALASIAIIMVGSHLGLPMLWPLAVTGGLVAAYLGIALLNDTAGVGTPDRERAPA